VNSGKVKNPSHVAIYGQVYLAIIIRSREDDPASVEQGRTFLMLTRVGIHGELRRSRTTKRVEFTPVLKLLPY
jgi:hypothetical protein